MMIEIIECGAIEIEDQVRELMNQYGQVIIPSEDQDLDLTHWWIIREECADMVYLGTPESFAVYIREQNGGVQ